MVAAVGAALDHRGAAEFASPDNERLVEQPAPLQVFHESGGGAVCVEAIFL